MLKKKNWSVAALVSVDIFLAVEYDVQLFFSRYRELCATHVGLLNSRLLH